MTTLLTEKPVAVDKPTVPHGRMDYIDALRGVACLLVLIFHNFGGVASPAIVSSRLPFRPKLGLTLTGFGWIGVPLFLVLSGFCLFYPIVSKMSIDKVTVDPRTFYRRRARRILPPYYAALFLFILMEHGYKHITGYSILLHVLMLQNLDGRVLPTINNAMWTLALECQLYVLFPLYLSCIRRFGIFGFVRITALVSIVWRLLMYLHLPEPIDWTVAVQYYEAVPGYAIVFAVGMAAAAMIARPDPVVHRRIRAYLLAALPITIAISLVGGFAYIFAGVLWGSVFAAMLVSTASITNSQVHSRPPVALLAKIGVFSYSVYLIHAPLLRLFIPQLWNLTSPTALAAYLLLRPVGLIGVAYVFFRIFEKPFLRQSTNTN